MRHDNEAVLALLATEANLLSARDAVACIRESIKAATDGHSGAATDPIQVAIERRLFSAVEGFRATARLLGHTPIDLYAADSMYVIDKAAMAESDSNWLEKLSLVLLKHVETGEPAAATTKPSHPKLKGFLAAQFDQPASVLVAPKSQIQQVLLTERGASGTPSAEVEAEIEEQQAEQSAATARSPVLTWLDNTLTSAVARGVSDLHFELNEHRRLVTRLRLDGQLLPHEFTVAGKDSELLGALMSKARMDPANRQEPQDGSFSFKVQGRKIDSRVAMIPLVTGPKIVVRLLDPGNLKTLEELGYSEQAFSLMTRSVKLPQGLIIIAGPTGSGKTTTLYAMLRQTADASRNVMTVENPVEYRLPLVSQIPIRDDLGAKSVTFGRALRTILRLDPDVILVGEIRDAETAQVALDAALTGHLVLSTIHAQTALGVFTRLVEIGAPEYLVAEALTLSISQRLVRKLHTCKEEGKPTDADRSTLKKLNIDVPDTIYVPKGCSGCGHTGYRGRIAIAELIAPDEEIRELVASKASMADLTAAAKASESFFPYSSDAKRLVYSGDTSVAELTRAMFSGQL